MLPILFFLPCDTFVCHCCERHTARLPFNDFFAARFLRARAVGMPTFHRARRGYGSLFDVASALLRSNCSARSAVVGHPPAGLCRTLCRAATVPFSPQLPLNTKLRPKTAQAVAQAAACCAGEALQLAIDSVWGSWRAHAFPPSLTRVLGARVPALAQIARANYFDCLCVWLSFPRGRLTR